MRDDADSDQSDQGGRQGQRHQATSVNTGDTRAAIGSPAWAQWSKLDAEALANLGADREPIRKLKAAIAERAAQMAPMFAGRHRAKQFQDEVSGVLKAWTNDRANMSGYWRSFFGAGAIDPAAGILERIVNTIFAGGSGAALTGLVVQDALLTSGAGVGIGLFSHAARTAVDLRKKDRASPYRYLTVMENAGVVIRTDLWEGRPPRASKAGALLDKQPGRRRV